MENFELLKHIYEASSMGSYATNRLVVDLKEKDNKIKSILESILKEYTEFKEISEKRLNKNKIETEEPNFMIKVGTFFGVKKEILSDNSDSSIADMMIRGLSMGSIELEKKVKAYKEVDKNDLKLADEFLSFQQKYIELLKEYL